MEKNKKILIIMLVVIFILMIAICILLKKGDNLGNEVNVIPNDISEEIDENEFVEVSDGGKTKINISDKIKNAKFNIDGLEIKNIKLNKSSGKTNITADIINNSSEIKGDLGIRITLLNKKGEALVEVGGYIGNIKPGNTSKLNASATLDYANAYDIKIEKK